MARPKKTRGNPSVAVAILRVSTEEQTVTQQRDAIERWAAVNGVVVVAWFSEEGVSGATPLNKRPAMLEALASLRPNRAGVLVAAKRDRIARDVSTAAAIERLTTEAGATLVTADGLDSGPSPEGQLIRAIIDAMAQYERALVGVRTKAALGAKKKRGECVGSVQYGYEAVGGKVVEHQGEQQALMRMRLLRASGATHKAIASALTREGYQPRGERWHTTTVQRALATKV
jgi:site-specific DNA recombinase